MKSCLLLNIENVIDQQEGRQRTRKVYSHDENREVIDYMHKVIQNENLDPRAVGMKSLNDLIYACQLTYQEVTEKPKKESNWKMSIENKIGKIERQLEVLNQCNQNEAPSKELIQLCKRNLFASNSNEQVEKLKDQLEEKRDAYKKKVKRMCLRRE